MSLFFHNNCVFTVRYIRFLSFEETSFTRHIRVVNYERSYYDLKASEIPQKTLKNDNVDTYADNLYNAVMTIARKCIKKHVKIKVAKIGPHRITFSLNLHIRKRQLAYKKADISFLKRG